MKIEGKWYLYFAWKVADKTQRYYKAEIDFLPNGTTSDGASWTENGESIEWKYENKYNHNTYTGTQIGYAMVGKMSGSFEGGWWYAVKEDIPMGNDAIILGENQSAILNPKNTSPN